MNDDELKDLWRQQPLRDLPPTVKLFSAVRQQTSQLRSCLQARDLREAVVAVVLILVFGALYFTVSHDPISRLGDLIVIAGLIFIPCKLIYTRRSTPPAPAGATTVEFLRAELKAVQAQARLLGSILWWYLLPLAVGLFLFTWGNPPGSVVGKIGYSLLVAGVCAFIYRLNQRARTTQLLPVEAQLRSLLHSAETGQPLHQEQATDLIRSAPSNTDPDQVKPVWFKVGFWQIALFGEIGFIGIWFFLMLSRALDHPDISPQAPELATETSNFRPLVQSRYTRVAEEIVDLLNKGDFKGIQALYNGTMSLAFPPEQTSDFYSFITARFGTIKQIEGEVSDGYRGWTAFRLSGQRGELTMSLALDAQDRISGIHFQPVLKSVITGESLAGRLFSPHHLFWIVPFFLAGLLYSWLIQKITERAVGISILGIHLSKGLILLPWDEIKEIRPFRLLHIRSLWLIKEGGKKSLIPWSSLARHHELKAAVESAAPPNHPLRSFLSLLR